MNVLSSTNYKLLALGVVLLAVGYILLAQGPVYNPLSWTVAPLVLVAAYCVVIPLAIAANATKEKNRGDNKKSSGV